jgi:hypothetical protein
MKLKATYIINNANPFLPSFQDFIRQFQYATADVPDDSDMVLMENFAREKTPENYKFLNLEIVEKGGSPC